MNRGEDPTHWARNGRCGSRDSVTDGVATVQPRAAAWLTRRRLWTIGAIMLAAQGVAVVVLVAGASGGLDALGRPLGSDFLAFWSAARLAVIGEPAAAWDLTRLFETGRLAVPGGERVYVFSYPPVFQMMLMPLGRLDWLVALGVWSGLGLALYAAAVWLAARRLPAPGLAMLLGLSFPAAFVNLLQGQTGVFSLVLLGGGLLLVAPRPVAAGILIGLACFKPHLGLLVPLALLAGGCWRALAAAVATVAGLVVFSLIVLGPAPWAAFLSNLSLAGELVRGGIVPWPKMPSVLAALRLAGAPEGFAWIGQAVAAVVAATGVLWLWATRPGRPVVVAATLCAALLVPPHVNDHDLVLLALPLAVLVAAGSRGRWLCGEPGLLALVWLAPMVLAPLARVSGFQSGPLLVLALFVLATRRALAEPPGGSAGGIYSLRR